MILLLSYAPKDELENTRITSLAWNSQIAEDNKEEKSNITPTSNPSTQAIESREEGNYLITFLVVGALVGTAFVFILKIFKGGR
jgi:hypothetical protein